jgi:hypothetical protein
MNGISEHQIEAIQSSGYKAAIVVSGGGSGAVHALLVHPGASRFVLEAQIPYSPEAMFGYLGETLGQFCSAEAAAVMAERALERALVFSLSTGNNVPLLGISCTAALQTTRVRRGNDRAFICLKSRREKMVREVELSPGSRAEQEGEVSTALLNLIAEFVGRESV